MEKRDFAAILVHLKKYIKIKKDIKGLVQHKHVFGELGVTSQNLTNWTARNSIPYEVILDYCLEEGIDSLNIFYDKSKVKK